MWKRFSSEDAYAAIRRLQQGLDLAGRVAQDWQRRFAGFQNQSGVTPFEIEQLESQDPIPGFDVTWLGQRIRFFFLANDSTSHAVTVQVSAVVLGQVVTLVQVIDDRAGRHSMTVLSSTEEPFVTHNLQDFHYWFLYAALVAGSSIAQSKHSADHSIAAASPRE